MTQTRWNDERGSALPLLAIVLGGMALALSVLLVQAQHRVRLAQAQWAADGSALAAAAEVVAGPSDGGSEAGRAASAVARANGASVVSIVVIGQPSGTSHPGINDSTPISPTVSVEVELHGVRARAAAARFAVIDP